MQIVIEISKEKYHAIIDKMYCGIYDSEVYKAIGNGLPLPKGHGRLIDADAFIALLKDTCKRHAYKNLFATGNPLTVNDVFNSVIESLQNGGLAEGDSPTIIPADKEG